MFIYLHQLFIIFVILTISENFIKAVDMKLVSVNFEVFGRVQGVFFRRYTQEEAKKLGLKGWCMNTPHGTVKGVLEGDSNHVNKMKEWLEKVGSPKSRIDKAQFHGEKEIDSYTYDSFIIRR